MGTTSPTVELGESGEEVKIPMRDRSTEYDLPTIAKEARKRARGNSDGVGQVGASELGSLGEPKTFEDLFLGIEEELFDLMVSKQRDYGVGNIAKFGLYGVLVRTSDKLERLQNLIESGRAPSNESLEDTAKDIANYGMIMLAVMRGQWGLPLAEELEDEQDEKLREF